MEEVIKIKRDFDSLMPHEVEVFNNEYFRHLDIQRKLEDVIEHNKNQIRNENYWRIKPIVDRIKKHGFTSEDIRNSDNNNELKSLIWNLVKDNIDNLIGLPQFILVETGLLEYMMA